MGWGEKLKALAGLGAARGGAAWRTIPTADYYFVAAMEDFIARGPAPDLQRPVFRLGPNTWACDRSLVIIRYATAEELRRIEAAQWRSVHYVIDDLIPAAESSPELPADYRAKLAQFSSTVLPRILALQPVIVAPSQSILDVFPDLTGRLLDPTCLAMCDGQLPAPPTVADGQIDVAFLGTRSHAGALPLLEEIVRGLENACPRARLHLFFGKHLPPSLKARPNIVARAPIPWQAYRAFARTARFHIGLAPVQATAFAQARSITKIMDHAAVGAAGIYSRRQPFASVIDDVNGLMAGDAAEEWIDGIRRLAEDPDRLSAMAREGQRMAGRLGDPSVARGFWMRELGLESPTEKQP